jgi:hypothetical protein
MACPHCSTPAHNIKKEGCSKLFLISKRTDLKHKTPTETQEKKPKNKQMYLNVLEVRDYLKSLFHKESTILSLVFGQLIANT